MHTVVCGMRGIIVPEQQVMAHMRKARNTIQSNQIEQMNGAVQRL